MKFTPSPFNPGWLGLALFSAVTTPVHAQPAPITPASDGTGTVVNQNGNQIDINGGTLSGDGGNLFHSFQEFGLSEGQIANFISNPNIHNILGRVVGGNVSVIQGLIQVTGGNSNLFLINPAGVIFGSNASLNLPGSLTVTTATGIDFNGNTFQSVGSNNYADLVGNPSGYRFNIAQPGVILNEGELALQPGQNLTLLGGTVINTGTLSTPGGSVTMAAVPGESLVRISQAGQLLNLEVNPLNNSITNSAITPLSLPQLLTGGEAKYHANTVTVNAAGEVVLQRTNTIIPEQGAVAIASGIVDVSNTDIGGQIGVFGNTVGVLDATLNASGVNGGGNIRVGGDYQGQGLVPNANQTFVNNQSAIIADATDTGDGGRVIIWADVNTNFQGNITARSANIGNGGFVEISGKENLRFDGSVDVSAVNGVAGTILFDPKNIIIADGGNNPVEENNQFSEILDGDATFDADQFRDLTGEVILEANNDIVVDEPIITNSVETLELRAGRSIQVNADIDTSASNGNINLRANSDSGILANRETGSAQITQKSGTVLNAGTGNISLEIGSLGTISQIDIGNIQTSGNLTVNANGGNINRVAPESTIKAGNIHLETFGSGGIGNQTAPLRIDANNIEAEAGAGGIAIDFLNHINIGGVSDSLTGIVSKDGGNIILNTQGDLTLTENLDTVAVGVQTGDITIRSTGQVDTTPGEIRTVGQDSNSGSIVIEAEADLLTGFINSSSDASQGQAGNITLKSNTGNIDTTASDIYADAITGVGGNVTLLAEQEITVGFISTSGATQAGNIIITSNNGNIELSDSTLLADAFLETGTQGTITINAANGSIFKGESRAGFDPDDIGDFSGEVILEAYNDITVSDDINTSDSISIQAGRSIFLNADINTSSGNGNIVIRANDPQAAENQREAGAANITQQQGRTLNAGSGNILLQLGNAGEVGNISIDNMNTTGVAIIDANGGNIERVAETSQITAGSALFRTKNTAGIGSSTAPISINVNNLEARSGSGGVFFTSTSPSLTIGGISEGFDSIKTEAGSVFIDAAGDITLTGDIITGGQTATGGSIQLLSQGNINTTNGALDTVPKQPEGQGGEVTLSAARDILTGEIYTRGETQGGNINITAGGTLNTTADIIDASSRNGTGGNINLTATNDILLGFISTFGEIKGGDVTLETTAGTIDISQGFIQTESPLGEDGIITPALEFENPPATEPGTFEPSAEIEFDADTVADFRGKVVLEAYNDVKIDEAIVTSDSIQVKAGRSIFINADIDTSSGNGNIALRANNSDAAADLREAGRADIVQQAGTTIRAGSGNILFEMGDAGEVGNLQVGEINTTGLAIFDANGGKIDPTTDNSLITAGSVIFHTYSQGGIGTPTAPVQINVNNLEAVTGEAGAFLDSPNSAVTIGGVTNRLEGINSFGGGQISINAAGDINVTESIARASFFGKGGNIDLVSQGSIDVSQTEIFSFSANGTGGNITLNAAGDIRTGLIVAPGIQQGGSINITSQTGSIDTTANGEIANSTIAADADVTSTEVAQTFTERPANLNAFSEEGSGGNITLNAPGNIVTGDISSFGETKSGDVNLSSQTGDVTTGVIFSTTETGVSGDITVESSAGNISINHIATHSVEGEGGDISLSSQGNITIRNIASFGEQGSGDVNLQSNNGTIETHKIQTLSPGGESGNITLNTYSTSGDIQTSNLQTSGEAGSGQISITTTDGNVITEDLESSSDSGEAGGIEIDSGGDITTGDQTVEAIEGDANISNQAEGNITTGDQTATTEIGDANISNQAEGDITTENQTATSSIGDVNIDNNAGGNITTENQTATSTIGDVNIDNNAGDNITTGDQTSTTEIGDASISNNAGGNITTGDQTATSSIGDVSIDNNAGGNITTGNQTATTEIGDVNLANNASGNILTGNQTAITQEGNATLLNNAGGNIVTGNQTSVTNNGEATITNQTPVNLTTGNQIALENGGIGSINNQVGGEINIQNPQSNNIVSQIQTHQIQNNITETPVNPSESVTPTTSEPAINSPIQLGSNIVSERAIASVGIERNPNPTSEKTDQRFENSPEQIQNIMSSLNAANPNVLSVQATGSIALLDQNRSLEYSHYFGDDFARNAITTESVQEALKEVESQTGTRSAIIYITLLSDQVDLVIFTAQDQPIRKTVSNLSRSQVLKLAQTFRSYITNPRYRNSQKYLESAQQLYQWFIEPLEAELKAQSIDTLLFSMDSGLRSLPIAALHDGEKFLVEQYSLSLIPSVTLTDMRYRSLEDTQVLAMGASQFNELNPLPAVPIELTTITQQLWQGNAFLEQQFTRENLINERQQYPYPIIHLATHGEFRAGDASQSYIQLWGDEQLKLNELRKLGWHEPAVELLVLSACRTALGDEQAELGFAGLAVQAGVKSALASLWYVSDEGTLGLMTEFYTHLSQTKIKSEALRQAQLAMIQGNVVIEAGELRGSLSRGATLKLPKGLIEAENMNLSHPYYWAGFTMIGSPW
ncbi:MAG: CHAT domain-containing protein [Cyanobacteria bacterium J06592_8]